MGKQHEITPAEEGKKINLLSLDDLYGMLAARQYRSVRECYKNDAFIELHSIDPDRIMTAAGLHWFTEGSLLYQHIVSERLWTISFRETDWIDGGFCDPREIIRLAYLWMHPLAWIDSLDEEQLVSRSKVAKETFYKRRGYEVYNKAERLNKLRTNDFVNKFPKIKYNSIKSRSLKGLHSWNLITDDTMEQVKKMTDDTWGNFNEPVKYNVFNPTSLYNNLTYIAERYGGATAETILKTFQSEWSSIKMWKAMGVDKYTDEYIQTFEQCLMHGFERDLPIWKNDSRPNKFVLVITENGNRHLNTVTNTIQNTIINVNAPVETVIGNVEQLNMKKQ